MDQYGIVCIVVLIILSVVSVSSWIEKDVPFELMNFLGFGIGKLGNISFFQKFLRKGFQIRGI